MKSTHGSRRPLQPGARDRRNGWRDLFVAWAPSKHFSATLACLDLGDIVGHQRQTDAHFSLQLGY